jgi:hypothetical protein
MVHLSYVGYHSAESSPMVKEDEDFASDFELVLATEDKVKRAFAFFLDSF